MTKIQEDSFPITGKVSINLSCDSPGDNVTLHMKNITVISTKVTTVGGDELQKINEMYDKER
ncbi:unnamed protein product [Darwinula stevensoni]|nr:unnamed protein product [Darwinula stevensoni]CAG0900772.1 unnamed protein product [Darwinula stevensoni]